MGVNVRFDPEVEIQDGWEWTRGSLQVLTPADLLVFWKCSVGLDPKLPTPRPAAATCSALGQRTGT